MTPTAHAASVAIFRAHEVLLIQRALPPFAGLWTLPGGRLEPDESIETCAIREVQEELGLTLNAVLPVTLLQMRASYTLQVFTAQMPEGTPQPSDEIADWCWANPVAIDHLKVTPGLAEVLATAAAKLASL